MISGVTTISLSWEDRNQLYPKTLQWSDIWQSKLNINIAY